MRIALCGEPRSGKDTVGNIISSMVVVHRTAFGKFMKFGYYKEHPEMLGLPKDREHMISWSQPLVDSYPNIWVHQLEREIEGYKNIVITDLRQPHEEKWCRENDFHIVRVHRPEEERRKAQLAKGENPDNKDLPYEVKADYPIYNDGSLEDLQSQVDNLLDCLNEIEMKRRRL
ncbi:hypothetical protein P9133_31985 [Bacillus thuringiensis]|uniref:Adenylate kinase n=1 Tax=Bacillus thuringiensis HD-771 TaxID=1218175 RepID=A0A9W3NW93_BACTU|nr:hypothetical protein [Bacillus thuringiensis]AFQ14639.1 hypothetical protein BTG_05735 [Bacillus thuringiensis HD-771]MEC3268939.1 hypothetical protein [Bacillus thuringiensis]MEC3515443.1 hypothetical protein [Bacillus thuringiensis]MED2072300.1 hypothetical protein [Bacillus thuringiensis]MED2223635.1 hypothetical protein [Bacillus thuringiensis]